MTTQLEQLRHTTTDMGEALARLGHKTNQFCSKNNVICKPGCGACCERPGDVWATVGEMLPMAWDVFERGDYDLVMERISRDDTDAMCVMFKPTTGHKGFGRCGEYPNRPITCILFGATTRNKDGESKLLACRYLTEQHSKTDHAVVADNLDAESLTWQTKSRILDSRLREEHPINKALKEALKLIQWANYASELINERITMVGNTFI